MTKNIFMMSLLLLAHSVYPANPPSAAMPSVKDVFGNMSQDDIVKQIELGQQFLQDLEKFGTPEEKAQFEEMLMQTLSQMTDEDLKDIQQIAEMASPYLPPVPEATPAIAPEPATAATPATTTTPVAASALEEFKNMISGISQRINDLLQKIESSKASAEQLNTRWTNKTTLSNMKRQIMQLGTQRLAQKLSATNISDEDQKLVNALKKFPKDLTEHNTNFVIEDDFGLPASRDIEQKYLSKTKNILNMFDQHIDDVMPKMEKFLTKWDPEALQLAKEADAKAAQAVKTAQNEAVAKPSIPAIPARATGSTSGSSRSQYNNNDMYPYPYMPEYGDYPTSAGNSNNNPNIESKDIATPKSSSQPQATPQKTEPAPVNKEDQEAKKQYNDIVDDFSGHVKRFDGKHEQSFDDFIKGISANYPQTMRVTQPDQDPGGYLQETDATGWIDQVLIPYQTSVFTKLNTGLSEELQSARVISDNAFNNLKGAGTNASKVTTDPNVNALEQRFKKYQASYEATVNDLTQKYNDTYQKLGDNEAQSRYHKQHNEFLLQLYNEIGKPVADVINQIGMVKHKSRRIKKEVQPAPTAKPNISPVLA